MAVDRCKHVSIRKKLAKLILGYLPNNRVSALRNIDNQLLLFDLEDFDSLLILLSSFMLLNDISIVHALVQLRLFPLYRKIAILF